MKMVPVLVSDLLSCVHCDYNKNKFASNVRGNSFFTPFQKWAPMAYFWCPSIREFYLDLVCANRVCVLL